jgi:hypothetical protein
MGREYLIFVPESNMDEDVVGYSAIINWCYENLSHPNLMRLTADDVYYLGYTTKVLDIINEENNSMIGAFEDDAIILNDVKIRIKRKLLAYEMKIKNNRGKEIVKELLRLIDVSIETNRNLYFWF